MNKILILFFACVSTIYIMKTIIRPNISGRIQRFEAILKNESIPPYQYRILLPYIGKLFSYLLSPFVKSKPIRHLYVYTLISFFIFLGINVGFYTYLEFYFPPIQALLGIATLNIVMQMSVTGLEIEGDFLTLLFYILGLLCLQSGWIGLIPLLIIVFTFNREQTIFFVMWYFLYFDAINFPVIIIGIISIFGWGIIYWLLHHIYGYKNTRYTIRYQIANNLLAENRNQIMLSWGLFVLPFVILSIWGYSIIDRPHQMLLWSLPFYVIAFFLKGNLWELTKFLPAHLIMITMGLNI